MTDAGRPDRSQADAIAEVLAAADNTWNGWRSWPRTGAGPGAVRMCRALLDLERAASAVPGDGREEEKEHLGGGSAAVEKACPNGCDDGVLVVPSCCGMMFNGECCGEPEPERVECDACGGVDPEPSVGRPEPAETARAVIKKAESVRRVGWTYDETRVPFTEALARDVLALVARLDTLSQEREEEYARFVETSGLVMERALAAEAELERARESEEAADFLRDLAMESLAKARAELERVTRERSRAMRERDDWGPLFLRDLARLVGLADAASMDAIYKAVAASREREQKLRDALRRFGMHKPECALKNPYTAGVSDVQERWRCDCGLTAALTEGQS